MVAAAVAVALAAVVVGAVLLTRGSSPPPLRGVSSARQLFAGIPQHGNVLGSTAAPATLIEYVDPQCVPCATFEARGLPVLLTRFVRIGKLRIEARPISIVGRESFKGISAALAAAEQNRMFEFMAVLFSNQGAENTGWLSDALLKRVAESVPGLDAGRLLSARSSGKITDFETRFAYAASAEGVTQAPAILVGKTGQKARQVPLSSPSDVAAVSAAITQALG